MDANEIAQRKILLEIELNELQPHHLIHFIATIFTGWWIIVWIIVSVIIANKRSKLIAEFNRKIKKSVETY